MKASSAVLAIVSVALVLLAILVSADSRYLSLVALAWAILAFYLAAVIQTSSLTTPAHLVTWPLVFLPVSLVHFIWIAFIKPPLYAVIWALGIKSRRQSIAVAGVPITWAALQSSPHLKRHQQSKGFNLLLGHSRRRLVAARLGTEAHHLLITGITGAGKSSVIRTILAGLLLEGPGIFDRVEVHILDNKGGLGRHFLPIIKVFGDKIISRHDEDAILADLEALALRIVERQRVMDDKLAETPEEADLGRILVIIDDLQDIIASKDIEAAIASISSKGRSAGVHVIISMPYSKADLLKSTISVNFHRISGFVRGGAERSIGISGLSKLEAHQFAYEETQRLDPILFSPYHITPTDIHALGQAFVTSSLDPDEILLTLFVEQGGLGRRELARQGLARSKVLYKDSIVPFPFSGIKTGKKGLLVTKMARDYIGNLVKRFEEVGIATAPAQEGQSYRPANRDVQLSIAIWRNHKQEEKS